MKNKKIQSLAFLLIIVLLVGQLCPMMVSAMGEVMESETVAETADETEQEDAAAKSVQESETETRGQEESKDQQKVENQEETEDQEEIKDQQEDESVPESEQENEIWSEETDASETETCEEEMEAMESVQLPSRDEVVDRLNRVVNYQQGTLTNPICGSIGGEWGIIGLARYGALSDSVKNIYLSNLYGTLEDKNGVLDPYGIFQGDFGAGSHRNGRHGCFWV